MWLGHNSGSRQLLIDHAIYSSRGHRLDAMSRHSVALQGKLCRGVRDPGRRSLHSLALGWYPSPLQGGDNVGLGVIHLPIVSLCGDEFVRPRIERLRIEAGWGAG